MEITKQDRLWHNAYEDMPKLERKAVDDAYNIVVKHLEKKSGLTRFRGANDHRAECLVAAIARYIVDSRK
jgi:hypothetical protein